MQVAVFGGGYAGVVAATRLEDRLPDAAELQLVDPRENHLVKHELHRLIRRRSMGAAIEIPFTEILDRAEHRPGRVVDIEPDEGVATLEDGDRLEYDAGVLAVGAAQAFHGMSGVREHGRALRRPADAIAIGEGMDRLVDSGTGRVVVGGAGLAGVQAAGELAELRADAGAPDVSITLLEQAERIAPAVAPGLATALADRLREKGVDVRTGTAVTGATGEAVRTDDGDQPYDRFVWTGGITGRTVVGGERPTVRSDLRLGDRTWAAGDAVRAIDRDGEAVPATARAAVDMAPVAADNAARRATADDGGFGPSYRRYRDRSSGLIVTVGDDTIAHVGPGIVTGAPARALKSVVGSRYLTTAGAIRNGVALARTEFGLAPP